MTDKKKSNGQAVQDGGDSTIAVTSPGQFIRDMSFENLAAQRKIWTTDKLNYDVQLQLDINHQNNNLYLVSMKVHLEGKSGKQTAYIMEVDYCGLFQVDKMPKSQLQPFLAIQCPHLMFPFVRRIVADTTRDGGFSPYNMELINFAAIYENEMLRKPKTSDKA